MIYYKPATQAVEPKGAPVKAKAPRANRLVLSPNGTLCSVEELISWDRDNSNRAGE